MKAVFPIYFTESPMVMLANELQYSKVWDPIDVTESGMVMLANELQYLKAFCPIDMTDFGMVMLVNEVQFMKALSPIDTTESGISKDINVPLSSSLIESSSNFVTQLAIVPAPSSIFIFCDTVSGHTIFAISTLL